MKKSAVSLSIVCVIIFLTLAFIFGQSSLNHDESVKVSNNFGDKLFAFGSKVSAFFDKFDWLKRDDSKDESGDSDTDKSDESAGSDTDDNGEKEDLKDESDKPPITDNPGSNNSDDKNEGETIPPENNDDPDSTDPDDNIGDEDSDTTDPDDNIGNEGSEDNTTKEEGDVPGADGGSDNESDYGDKSENVEEIKPQGPFAKFVKAHLRKLAHFTEYFILGIELFVLFTIIERRRDIFGKKHHLSFRFALSAFVIGGAVSFIDESIQIISERGSSVKDMWIDIAGVFSALIISYIVYMISFSIRFIVKGRSEI